MGALDRLFSSDSHFRVTPDQIKAHLAKRYHDEYDAAARTVDAPKVAAQHARGVAMDLSSFQHEAARHPGYSDPHARLDAMDGDGVEFELLFSDLSAFRVFHQMADGCDETARAFNDVALEFAAADPRRLLVAYQLALRDVDVAVAEVQRLADVGSARAVHVPNKPSALGLPDYYHERYDPLWATIQEMDMPICIHLGVEDDLFDIMRRDPTPQAAVFTSQPAMRLAEPMGFLLLTGVLERYPGLRVVFAETGLGWVPHYVDKLDQMYEKGAYSFPELQDKPSVAFHRSIFLTFMDDKRGVAMRHEIGVENILWSTDFPHPACTWPNSRAVVADVMEGVPDNEAELMVFGNGARLFGV
jgi:predicted TIM-barrel fold metal-dependent hydrolase